MLQIIQQPPSQVDVHPISQTVVPLPPNEDLLHTPVTVEKLTVLHANIENDFDSLSPAAQTRMQKLAHAAEKAFADRALLLDENRLPFEQNNEKTTRISARSVVTGNAKVISYEEVVETQRKREMKDMTTPGTRRRGGRPRKLEVDRSHEEEMEVGQDQIAALGLENHCSILKL